MARHVFYSLHYQADRSRAELVRNVGALSPNLEAKPAEWATLQRKGEFAIKHWFEQQLRGRSCTIVLIGAQTATRPLVSYELKRSWELKLGLLAIHIHNLKDAQGATGTRGPSPLATAELAEIAPHVQTFEPPEADSKLAYRYIADNLAKWVEHAVAERARHS